MRQILYIVLNSTQKSTVFKTYSSVILNDICIIFDNNLFFKHSDVVFRCIIPVVL